MPLTPDQLRRLADVIFDDELELRPDPPEPGPARAVPIVPVSAVMNRLDRVVGPGSWSFDWEPAGDGVKAALPSAGRAASHLCRHTSSVAGIVRSPGTQLCSCLSSEVRSGRLLKWRAAFLNRYEGGRGAERHWFLPVSKLCSDTVAQRTTAVPSMACKK